MVAECWTIYNLCSLRSFDLCSVLVLLLEYFICKSSRINAREDMLNMEIIIVKNRSKLEEWMRKAKKKECFIYENDRPLSSCFAVTHIEADDDDRTILPQERWATRMKWIMKTNFRLSLLLMMDKLRSSRGRVVGQCKEKILESQQDWPACQRRHQHSIGHRSTTRRLYSLCTRISTAAERKKK